jgi:outer membrane lipoprotein carrier protein
MNINAIKYCVLTMAINFVITQHVQANTQVVSINNSNTSIEQPTANMPKLASSEAKQILRAKLENLAHFTADFSQEVHSVSGEKIAQSAGNLAISKPNLANWHTTEPDELAIVSDGTNVWFYDPWIEQVSVYSLSAAIAKTPILLLTSKDENLWEQYTVTKENKTEEVSDRFVISAKDTNSQIKSLTLIFETNKGNSNLAQFSFLDATGQLSHIKLSNFEDQVIPKASLFQFVVPTGVQIDDQRSE